MSSNGNDAGSVADWGLELILRWVTQAETNYDRIAGLDAAVEAFHHYDEEEHGREIRDGAVAQTFYPFLVHVLGERSGYISDSDIDDPAGSGSAVLLDEILAKTMSILEMVHRCSLRELQDSFDAVGLQLLPLLLEVLDIYSPILSKADDDDVKSISMHSDDESAVSMVSSNRSQTSSLLSRNNTRAVWAYHAVNNSIRIISYFSILENGSISMGGHRAFIDTLSNVLNMSIENEFDEINDIVIDVLNVLSNYPKVEKMMNTYILLDSLMMNVCLNEKTSNAAKESAAHFLWSILEKSSKLRISLAKEDAVLEFLTLSMADSRITDEVNWIRCSAVKAVHLLCIPPENAERLVCFTCSPKFNSNKNAAVEETAMNKISFLQSLMKMVMDGSESFSAACGLCHLSANNEKATAVLSQPNLLDTMAKTALTNPNAAFAAEAVGKILPLISYDLFRRIVLLMTLTPNFCLSVSVKGILERAELSTVIRDTMAADECIVMILVKASRSDESVHVRVEATKVLQYLSISRENKLHLLENEDIVKALTKAMTEAHYGSGSSMSSYHESSAYATCALCNLVVDDMSNSEVYHALEPQKEKCRNDSFNKWQQSFRKYTKNISRTFSSKDTQFQQKWDQ